MGFPVLPAAGRGIVNGLLHQISWLCLICPWSWVLGLRGESHRSWEDVVPLFHFFQQFPGSVLWGQARPPVGESGCKFTLCKDLRPSFSDGAWPRERSEELGQHPPGPGAPTASSWIQCSWILRPWTTLMRTATSHPSLWKSVQLSVSGPTLSGTLSSPCKVSKGEKQVAGGGHL